jgi:hypothetical protein
MMLTRAPWFLAGLVGSALLLVVVVGALAWAARPGAFSQIARRNGFQNDR